MIEAGNELTLKAGGSFIKIDAGGVTITGAQIKLNSGGSPGTGAGAAPLLPGALLEADTDKAGELLHQASVQTLQKAATGAGPICEVCQNLEAAK